MAGSVPQFCPRSGASQPVSPSASLCLRTQRGGGYPALGQMLRPAFFSPAPQCEGWGLGMGHRTTLRLSRASAVPLHMAPVPTRSLPEAKGEERTLSPCQPSLPGLSRTKRQECGLALKPGMRTSQSHTETSGLLLWPLGWETALPSQGLALVFFSRGIRTGAEPVWTARVPAGRETVYPNRYPIKEWIFCITPSLNSCVLVKVLSCQLTASKSEVLTHKIPEKLP